ncbi:MAG: DJ-1/PfpI family protein [Gemmataceae bacterium]
MNALFLIADGFEDVQFFCLWNRLREEGVRVTLASPQGTTVTGLRQYTVATHTPIREVNPSEYDLLVIPGGYSPEKLRLREEAVNVTRTFMDEERRVVIIGHAAQLLITAGSISCRRVTASREIRDDIRAAGGIYRDEPVVVDGALISGRGSEEIPDVCRKMMAGLSVCT